MFCEIVTIGDEICRGEIADTNASWLAAELWAVGVTVAWMTSVRDHEADMRAALETAARRAELVLVSGGLGPTEDDLTVDVASAIAGAEPEIHERSLEAMRARYQALGYPVTDTNLRQVRTPRGARVYENPAGAAPGFEIVLGGTPLVFMPGFPRELKAIYQAGVGDRVRALRDGREGGAEHIARRRYRTFGKGESLVASAVSGLADAYSGASVHFQVQFPEVHVKVVVRDPDPGRAQEVLEILDAGIRERIGSYLFGTDDDSLPGVLGEALSARGMTVAVAESCTGGLVGSLITQAPGSSAYFLGGAIAYANGEKVRQLGVAEETLAGDGAVSEACALEMARGARDRTGADIAVAVTGVAGPGGGTDEKPVGLVWLAVAGRGTERTKRLMWPSARDQIQTISAYWALKLCLDAAAQAGRDDG